MASSSRVLYTGVTNNLVSGFGNIRICGFGVLPLVTALPNWSISRHSAIFVDANAKEKQIKGWLRTKKIALIESLNPQWKDLSTDLQ